MAGCMIQRGSVWANVVVTMSARRMERIFLMVQCLVFTKCSEKNRFETCLNRLNGGFRGFLEKKMKKVVFVVGLVFWVCAGFGQVIPLKPENWTFKPGIVQFGDSAGVARMKIVDKGTVVAKGVDFSDGTIEFDVLPSDKDFASTYFRYQDEKESECFYLRTNFGSDHPYRFEATQYTPIMGGTMCWDMFPHFQGNTRFSMTAFNHVKLVVSGKQLRVYVN